MNGIDRFLPANKGESAEAALSPREPGSESPGERSFDAYMASTLSGEGGGNATSEGRDTEEARQARHGSPSESFQLQEEESAPIERNAEPFYFVNFASESVPPLEIIDVEAASTMASAKFSGIGNAQGLRVSEEISKATQSTQVEEVEPGFDVVKNDAGIQGASQSPVMHEEHLVSPPARNPLRTSVPTGAEGDSTLYRQAAQVSRDRASSARVNLVAESAPKEMAAVFLSQNLTTPPTSPQASSLTSNGKGSEQVQSSSIGESDPASQLVTSLSAAGNPRSSKDSKNPGGNEPERKPQTRTPAGEPSLKAATSPFLVPGGKVNEGVGERSTEISRNLTIEKGGEPTNTSPQSGLSSAPFSLAPAHQGSLATGRTAEVQSPHSHFAEVQEVFRQALDAGQRMKTDNRSLVEVQLRMEDGSRLRIRMEWVEGALKPTFFTDSTSLKQALDSQWARFSSQAQERGLQILPVSFQGTGSGNDTRGDREGSDFQHAHRDTDRELEWGSDERGNPPASQEEAFQLEGEKEPAVKKRVLAAPSRTVEPARAADPSVGKPAQGRLALFA